MELNEFLDELTFWGIQYSVSDWRIVLEGGDKTARFHYDNVIAENKEIQAMLILYAANKDETLRDLIEERAAIRWADGLPGDMLSAVICNLQED